MARTKATAEGTEIILAGPPTSVSGFVTYGNATADDVAIDHIVVRDPDGVEATLPVEPVTVSPDRTARIAVRLAFGPQTAPGAYPLELDVAETTLPAVAHVTDTHDFAFSPDILVIDNVPDAQVTATVIVVNDGNVPGYLADFGAVPLYREDTALPTLLALANASSLTGTPDMEPLPETETSIEVTAGGRVVLAPGKAQRVDLQLVVPKDLDQTTRYVAALPISVRTLLVVVVPAGPEGDESRPSKTSTN